MSFLASLLRFCKIIFIITRFGLLKFIFKFDAKNTKSKLVNCLINWFLEKISSKNISKYSDGVRLRLALEKLGPLFIKFGQVLSTRRDLLSLDMAFELAKLQDKVPPFSGVLAINQIEAALGQKIDLIFSFFDVNPIASASVAQVHFAKLYGSEDEPDSVNAEVAVKVLRPNILRIIEKDLALLCILAKIAEFLFSEGRRLKLSEIVAQFDLYLHDEIDLLREAANASQLKRNFVNNKTLLVPKVYWHWCRHDLMVMERMHGVPISQIDELKKRGVNLPKLARTGVEIFFAQVFRDGFFHADMHPGNILVSVDPKTLGCYIALDFGIVGTLSSFDKNYLAQNFLAFFKRDYSKVAALHIESGWAPIDTRAEALEAAVRSVCEPYFDRPLKNISLGVLLMRLFQASRRFKIEIQPQLMLLQKTLLNIEGLGRQIDPQLDLWSTAMPFLERWVKEQLGWRGLLTQLGKEAPHWAQLLPELPRLTAQFCRQYIAEKKAVSICILEQSSHKKKYKYYALALCAALLMNIFFVVKIFNNYY